MKVGVFDSGVGGEAVAKAIQLAFPAHEVFYAQDKKNVPYGLKTPEELQILVEPILHDMVQKGTDVIIIACNTVTTTIIDELREKIKLPLIGVEPMVKPASLLTKSNIIAVCATPTTLNSARYRYLVETYAKHITVLEPDCSQWAFMIENSKIDHKLIANSIEEVCNRGADVIVLGCTHYHWIEEEIKEVASQHKAIVVQPEQAIIKELRRVLARLG